MTAGGHPDRSDNADPVPVGLRRPRPVAAARPAVPPQAPPPPRWLIDLAGSAARMDVLPPLQPPSSGGRPAAVLILFAEGPAGPDLLFIERSQGMRQHPGQPAFPGGAIDAIDSGPAAAALREAAEEAGVDPGSVDALHHAARAVHLAQRFPGRPGPGLVAFPGPGVGGGPGRGGGRGTDQRGRAG